MLPKPGGVEPEGVSSGLRWVRTQDWKLYQDGRLFHMAEDPTEQYALSAAQDYAMRKTAREQLEQAFEKLGL